MSESTHCGETVTSELGTLSNPTYHSEAIDIAGFNAQQLFSMLQTMALIRAVELQIAELVESKEARCPCHLAIGQEAIPVGVSSHLRKSDRIFGAHRSHGHYIAVGGDVGQLLAEVLGKETGCSKGMGGSMHLLSMENGFYGSVPIVGATIPIATGAAMALKFEGKCDISVSYFGDGASEEGVLHESLNLASIKDLPVLYVCENNLYSSHLDIAQRQPSDRCSRFAAAHKIEHRLVDGNDAAAVSRASAELISMMRQKSRPGFLEAVTYRHCGHVGPDANIDVGLRRKLEDVIAWKRRDPIERLKHAMIEGKVLDQSSFEKMSEEIRSTVSKHTAIARKAPYPDAGALLARVRPSTGEKS